MTIQVNGKALETDEEGFLMDPEDWDRSVAEAMACVEELELDEERWNVVMYVRDYYERNHSVPEARTILKEFAKRYGEERGTRKYLYKLFPYGYGQQACKIAGMRKPRKLMLDV